jgi:hypothetical protein
MFNEHYTEEDAHQARAKAARVAPEVNLAADEADHVAVGNSAGGEIRSARPDMMLRLLAAQDVAQQYNQHAEAALQVGVAQYCAPRHQRHEQACSAAGDVRGHSVASLC